MSFSLQRLACIFFYASCTFRVNAVKPSHFVRSEEHPPSAPEWAAEVRQAMQHTWSNYKARAWGHDSIRPVSGESSDWCGLAVTILDGLSTLSLMGMTNEVQAAADWMQGEPMPKVGKHGFQSLFEINIRAMGGLLAANALTGNQVFLDTAHRLGEHLINAFNTSSGLPFNDVDVGTGNARGVEGASLARVGTFQMEFPYLSHVTGDSKFELASDRAQEAIWRASHGHALVPISLLADGEISFGGDGDSYYEYLLKAWLLTGKKNDLLKRKWIDSANEMVETMVKTSGRGRLYLGKLSNGKLQNTMSYLACFVPGMLMLGSRTLPKKDVNPRWDVVAHGLADTCYNFHEQSATGLAPQEVRFSDDPNVDTVIEDGRNALFPEIAESIYYMWYFTGDPKYRAWSYSMFSAFQKYSKSTYGYSSVLDVDAVPPTQADVQESFWLAETLKYFYLTFSPRNTLDLNKWVLTTEAHPLPVYDVQL